MLTSLRRIEKEARGLDYFKSINCYTEENLDAKFLEIFKNRLKFGSRGFGYWCWKPQIILQLIEEVEDGDLIVWCDAGCQITGSARPVFESYVRDAIDSKDGFCVFNLDPSKCEAKYDIEQFSEERWTKEDLFNYMGIERCSKARKSPQVAATFFVFRVSEVSKELIKLWRSVYIYDFSLADDSESKMQNSKKFIEHRHDQSIFSLLISQRAVSMKSFFLELDPNMGLRKGEGVVASRNKKFTFSSRKKRQLDKIRRKLFRVSSSLRNV